MLDPRRRFNRTERNALYLAAGGRCAACGVALPAGFHADHVTPHAKGGRTDVANGAALCPACNIKKGAGVVAQELTAGGLALRGWQRDAWSLYRAKLGPNFLAAVTPGGGKTYYACFVASRLLDAGAIRRIVVVVPSNLLRRQWALEAAKHGIQLDYKFVNDDKRPTRDYDGIVTTYSSVGKSPLVYRSAEITNETTLVIFDEIHHARFDLNWGSGLREAFEFAGRRLAITGTPFRSDRQRVPFIEYDAEGRCVADVRFSYGEAIRDGVCRPAYFPSFEGTMTWFTEQYGERTATFSDELPDDEQSRRLRTALQPSGEWLPRVLADADSRLIDVRTHQYSDAAGLVYAIDRTHALAIRDLLARITGERPWIVLSDMPEDNPGQDNDPAVVLKEFRNGRDRVTGDRYAGIPRWMVAVRMLSEGVDVPRATVGVYASNVLTELALDQALGRVIRAVSGYPDLASFLFVPKVEPIVSWVLRVKDARDHGLREIEEREERERQQEQRVLDGFDDVKGVEENDHRDRPVSTFVPGEAIAEPAEVYFDHEGIPQQAIARARAFALAFGYEGMNHELLAKIMLNMESFGAFTRDGVVPTTSVTIPSDPNAPSNDVLVDVKAGLKADATTYVNKLARSTGLRHDHIHRCLADRTGARQPKSTTEELKHRVALLKGWIELAFASRDEPLAEFEWDEVMRYDRQPAR